MSGVILGPKDPDSTEYFRFDYTNDSRFATGETIISATVTVTVMNGRDSNASALLSGPVIISGLTVSQLITGGILGVTYDIKCLATTSSGQVLDACGQVTIVDC